MLERIKVHVDGRLHEEQAGFRNGRSRADQIATLRIIIEQSIEFQTSLCLNFVDFEKAFGSIDHQVLWALLRHYGLPEKFIRMIQLFYNNFRCQVIHGGTLTEPFKVTTDVRQGFLLSPLLFLVVLNWETNI